MDFLEAVRIVEADASFDRTGYLVHGFLAVTDAEEPAWHVGYYDTGTDRITSYEVRPGEVFRQPPSEAFKDGGAVPPLVREHVKIDHRIALSEAQRVLRTDYPQHPLLKSLLLVQHTEEGLVHNITLVTHTLHILNIRLDATTGAEVRRDFQSILSLKQE